jgi:hypothetical protein
MLHNRGHKERLRGLQFHEPAGRIESGLQISSLSALFSASERADILRVGRSPAPHFPDIRRAIPEISPAARCLHREFHVFPVHQNHVLETRGEAAGFRSKFALKRIDKAYGSIR